MGGGSLKLYFYFFSYERHVNAIPSEGHQALPKSRRGRERKRERRGKGERGGGGREEEEKGFLFQTTFIERGWQIL